MGLAARRTTEEARTRLSVPEHSFGGKKRPRPFPPPLSGHAPPRQRSSEKSADTGAIEDTRRISAIASTKASFTSLISGRGSVRHAAGSDERARFRAAFSARQYSRNLVSTATGRLFGIRGGTLEDFGPGKALNRSLVRATPEVAEGPAKGQYRAAQPGARCTQGGRRKISRSGRPGPSAGCVATCAECGSPSGLRWAGWRAYRVDDPEKNEPPALAFYCPSCAAREFSRRV